MALIVIPFIEPRLYALEVCETCLVLQDTLQDLDEDLNILHSHLVETCLVVEEGLPETLLPVGLPFGQLVLLLKFSSALIDLLCCRWAHFSGFED